MSRARRIVSSLRSLIIPLAAVVAAVVAIVLAFLGSLNGPPVVEAIPVTCQWSNVQGPDSGFDSLKGITAIASNDIWAVGSTDPGSGGSTLTIHWDGTAWSAMPSPNISSNADVLFNVDAIASNDVWAVGTSNPGSKTSTLIEHWDGISWTLVSGQNPGPDNNFLYDVEAIAPNDVWAVGALAGSSTSEVVVQHWDGSSWSVIPTPSTGTQRSGLVSIDAVSANDIWAVGFAGGLNADPLIEHWNGSAWSIVASPVPPTTFSNLRAIDVISADDIWAVGTAGSSTSTQVLMMHWDGISWTEHSPAVPSEINPADINILIGVSGSSSDDVWAVGEARINSGLIGPLLLHWDGVSWALVDADAAEYPELRFQDVVALGTYDVWAVGAQEQQAPFPIGVNVLIQRCVTDSDSDGLLDPFDSCPNDPEDFDGFEDEDGCPDPDNDGDGILDIDDACPNLAGVPEHSGCPTPGPSAVGGILGLLDVDDPPSATRTDNTIPIVAIAAATLIAGGWYARRRSLP